MLLFAADIWMSILANEYTRTVMYSECAYKYYVHITALRDMSMEQQYCEYQVQPIWIGQCLCQLRPNSENVHKALPTLHCLLRNS